MSILQCYSRFKMLLAFYNVTRVLQCYSRFTMYLLISRFVRLLIFQEILHENG